MPHCICFLIYNKASSKGKSLAVAVAPYIQPHIRLKPEHWATYVLVVSGGFGFFGFFNSYSFRNHWNQLRLALISV